MKSTGPAAIFEGNPYEMHRYQQHQLGCRMIAANGDIFRYTWAGASTGTDFIAGYLYTALGIEANHQNMTVAVTTAVGDTKIVVDAGATTVDANEYDEGFLIFSDNSPEGETYTVTKHEANAGSLETDIWVHPALKTISTVDSSEVSLVRNVWNRPAISQLIAERCAGVAFQDWDLSAYEQYGWLKTHGVAAVLVDADAPAAGDRVTVSGTTNGAVGEFADIDAESPIGKMLMTSVSAEFNPVYLTID